MPPESLCPEFPDSVRSGSCTLGPCCAVGARALPAVHLGSLPELAPPGDEGSQWVAGNWLSGGPVPPQRRGWQRGWHCSL